MIQIHLEQLLVGMNGVLFLEMPKTSVECWFEGTDGE